MGRAIFTVTTGRRRGIPDVYAREPLAVGAYAARERGVALPLCGRIAWAAEEAGAAAAGRVTALCCAFYSCLELRRRGTPEADYVSDVFFGIFAKCLVELGAPWAADEFLCFMRGSDGGDYARFVRRLAALLAASEGSASPPGMPRQ